METKFLSLTDGKMAYYDEGIGYPVVLLHGLPTSKTLWHEIIPQLVQTELYRVIVPDLLQYGESEQVDRHFTHKERATHVKEFLNHLEIKQFHMVVHDLGSSVAIDFLGKYGSMVNNFVIMSPPVYPDFKPPFLVRLNRLPVLGPFMIRFFLPVMFQIGIGWGLNDKSAYTSKVAEGFRSNFKDTMGRKTLFRLLKWGEPETEFADYPEIIQSIVQPTLIIHGRNDPYIPLEHSMRLEKDIENATLRIIETGSHFLPLDFGDEISKIIIDFLG